MIWLWQYVFVYILCKESQLSQPNKYLPYQQVIRLHLPHAASSEAVVLRLYFPKLQRYDVYVDDTYVAPKNLDTSKLPAYQLLGEGAEYEPTLSDVSVANIIIIYQVACMYSIL